MSEGGEVPPYPRGNYVDDRKKRLWPMGTSNHSLHEDAFLIHIKKEEA